MKIYDAVLLDMDGTFLDSGGRGDIKYKWAYDAFKKTMRRYGIRLSTDEIRVLFWEPLLSLSGKKGVLSFCERFGLDPEKFWEHRERDVIEEKIKAIKRGEIKLYDRSEEAIKKLSESFSLAVVSDSQQECVDFAIEYFNLKDYFKVWYGRGSKLDDLEKRKPNPYYINKVLDEFGTRKAILVDDSPLGVEAAKNAGIDSALLVRERGGRDPALQKQVRPTYLIRKLSELL